MGRSRRWSPRVTAVAGIAVTSSGRENGVSPISFWCFDTRCSRRADGAGDRTRRDVGSGDGTRRRSAPVGLVARAGVRVERTTCPTTMSDNPSTTCPPRCPSSRCVTERSGGGDDGRGATGGEGDGAGGGVVHCGGGAGGGAGGVVDLLRAAMNIARRWLQGSGDGRPVIGAGNRAIFVVNAAEIGARPSLESLLELERDRNSGWVSAPRRRDGPSSPRGSRRSATLIPPASSFADAEEEHRSRARGRRRRAAERAAQTRGDACLASRRCPEREQLTEGTGAPSAGSGVVVLVHVAAAARWWSARWGGTRRTREQQSGVAPREFRTGRVVSGVGSADAA